MNEISKRVDFITNFLGAFEEKIKLLNSVGLFDNAVLFELFAAEICNIYYDVKFINLNIEKPNYPCVDLISYDKRTYIQVSTAKDIPNKIKTTLEKIKDSTIDELKSLTNVKFFVLSNDSIDKVKSYEDESQIGNVSFNKDIDLITTQNILEKAKNNLEFQIKLYHSLFKESQIIENNSEKLLDAVDISKIVGLNNIDCKINGEYEIDRTDLINLIVKENFKNICIVGNAGSGKSVLCKKLIEDKKTILYARAENFLSVSSINEIWGFEVKETFKYCKGKEIYIFIDALEFTSDNRSKLELLNIFYEVVNSYPLVKIITSCRSCDINAFIKLINNYSVNTYEAPDLLLNEQLKISDKYPVIGKTLNLNTYNELLKSPFYINLIITKISDIDNIKDENELRDFIWFNIICLGKNEIQSIIEDIVFTRAKNFMLAVNSKKYNSDSIKNLISEDILINNNGHVRLKYDIYEDICFEQFFDDEFTSCRGDYIAFFTSIKTFGRCIYRRYQIWIANKLFAKKNREKFLYNLIFLDDIPVEWKIQTEIGIIKSRYSTEFFDEYRKEIITKSKIRNLIKVTNLYAFNIKIISNDSISFVKLKPVGEGRKNLIQLIYNEKLYMSNDLKKTDIEKICKDYSLSDLFDAKTSCAACEILQYYIDKVIDESESFYGKYEIINNLLCSLYQMVEYSGDWIKSFWIKLIGYLTDKDNRKNRLAEEIIKDTISSKHIKLTKLLSIDLCKLTSIFFTEKLVNNDRYANQSFYEKNELTLYGFNENAKDYEQGYIRKNPYEDNFFYFLFSNDFWTGLDWCIYFINKAIVSYDEKAKKLKKYEIYFISTKTKKIYFGSENMWFATIYKNNIPRIISDLLFCLKLFLIKFLKTYKDDIEFIKTFGDKVKNYIYDRSNNIALLSIIAFVGIEFRDELPGFALDLATNIDVLYHELSRKAYNQTPSLLDRYYNTNSSKSILQDYVAYYQFNKGFYNTYDMCYSILDYLYSQHPNDEKHAKDHLQIQYMDFRNSNITNSGEMLIISPVISGEAKKVVEKHENLNEPENNVRKKIEKFNNIEEKDITLQDYIDIIDLILNEKEKFQIMFIYDNYLMDYIAKALQDANLRCDNRIKYCKYWINGLNELYNNKVFVFDQNTLEVLINQLEEEIPNTIKNEIKLVIFKFIAFNGNNGLINDISSIIEKCIKSISNLTSTFFNTIVKLAEDEMNHQKYNAMYASDYYKDESFKFIPNLTKKLSGIDYHIEKDGGVKFFSNEENIIENFLLKEQKLDLNDFNLSNYDISIIINIVKCGIDLNNSLTLKIVKTILHQIIAIYSIKGSKVDTRNILDWEASYNFADYLKNCLVNSKYSCIIVDLLFSDNVDFSIFSSEIIEFYQYVFDYLSIQYFNAYDNLSIRSNCVDIIHMLEKKISLINHEAVRICFYKSLTFSGMKYMNGDWSKFPSDYSYKDKQFLNEMFSKFGKYHFKELLITIYNFNIKKLLPEILISIERILNDISEQEKFSIDSFSAKLGGNERFIIKYLIAVSFIDFSDKIKEESDLTAAFENILNFLIELNYEEAAAILDEFRIH